jgi:hypothetical protein
MVALSRVRARFYLKHQIGCGTRIEPGVNIGQARRSLGAIDGER